jgi:hypothetical protein
MRNKNSSLRLLVGLALFVVAMGSPDSHARYSATAEALIRRVLATPHGTELAKVILGPQVTRFNPGGSREVINALTHPQNVALADNFSLKIEMIEAELDALKHYSRHLPFSSVLAREEQLIAERAKRLFEFVRSNTGEIAFIGDGTKFRVHTAYTARRQTFLQGGEVIGLKPFGPRTLPASPQGFRSDAIEQLLIWEETASLRYFRETEQFVGLRMSVVDSKQVVIRKGSALTDDVGALFIRGGKVYWPQHPYNADQTVPFFGLPEAEIWPARFTASRSLIVWNRAAKRAFSLKAPTNYPHRTELQQAKVRLNDDIDSAIVRSNYIDRIERMAGRDDRLILLKETLTVADKTSGNGFVVRDLSPLMDGHYYIPALSIPYAGESIARLNGREFAEFWGESYAKLLGASKARMMLRYGIQMETPNSQNMLIQLDRNMKPTGRMVFRDVSDSFTVRPVLEAMGESKTLIREARIGYDPVSKLEPFGSNSLWRLDEDPIQGISKVVLIDWLKIHDAAYIDEVLNALRVSPLSDARKAIKSIKNLESFLFSPDGVKLMRVYHRELRKAASGQAA